MRFALIAHQASETNAALVAAGWPGAESLLLTPAQAVDLLEAGDVALARLDVRSGLDGVERGFRKLNRLRERGVTVLNPPPTLLASHDKLITAARLRRTGIPHPRTAYITPGGGSPPLRAPAVVKPRFGSWGRDVFRCDTKRELDRILRTLRDRSWFQRQGALVQELVPPRGYDVRVIVAAGQVVGAVKRVAQPGEWRTNVALGARRHKIRPGSAARALAVAAASAVDGDLVGVDLLPEGHGGYVVLEVNGSADFTQDYSLGDDVYKRALGALSGSNAGTAAAASL